ncbi:hypothetical protein BPBIEBS31_73 [Mycobacterium phage BPBiebs31]|uniref:Uncharacterized protein n=1 Tax=Mycobacterium phage BPBiebs31 TaxID=2902900 RepID=G1DA26_9CAUD|nr:hypothetical protein FGG18_gp29 [Mycobacterium phage BPBiebs31]AEJ91962.1 hypothetical protein BPBIEBS31_73 [Mycobacterium phage BPBiebs31]AZF97257.1 hypothetical protein SEA_FROGHOPPER_67 [Mycobacterium phage Froghopper]
MTTIHAMIIRPEDEKDSIILHAAEAMSKIADYDLTTFKQVTEFQPVPIVDRDASEVVARPVGAQFEAEGSLISEENSSYVLNDLQNGVLERVWVGNFWTHVTGEVSDPEGE